MFSTEKAKAKAAKLGQGVTFEKSEPLTVGANKGARVTYRFTDINTLKVAPGDGMSDMSPIPGTPPNPTETKPITFTYAGGLLTVTMPEPGKAQGDAAKPANLPNLAGSPEGEAIMKQMMADMKISLKLIIEPGIAQTDAAHRDGKTITLIDMEMGKILDKPDTLKKLISADPSNPAASLELLKSIEGVKMETKKQITTRVD